MTVVSGHVTIADQVRRLIAQHLDIAAETVTDEARFRDDLGADSLDAFELLLAFEETFDIEIPDAAADPMQCVRDAIAYIEAEVGSGRSRRLAGRTTDPWTEPAGS
jgi:acyl carrier protein